MKTSKFFKVIKIKHVIKKKLQVIKRVIFSLNWQFGADMRWLFNFTAAIQFHLIYKASTNDGPDF